MAQQIVTTFIDDIDGGPAEGTVRFALDGESYEIDLNEQHEKELREILGKYVPHSRKAFPSKGGRGSMPKPRGAHAGGSNLLPGESLEGIRQWLKGHGWEMKDRGRLPGALLANYRNQTPAPGWVDPAAQVPAKAAAPVKARKPRSAKAAAPA